MLFAYHSPVGLPQVHPKQRTAENNYRHSRSPRLTRTSHSQTATSTTNPKGENRICKTKRSFKRPGTPTVIGTYPKRWRQVQTRPPTPSTGTFLSHFHHLVQMAAPAHSLTGQEPSTMEVSARRRKTEQATTSATSAEPATPDAPNGHAHVRHEEGKPSQPRKKPRSLLRRLKRRAIKHTWSIPLLLLVAFASLYALDPTESNVIHHFIFLSYRQDAPVSGAPAQYGKGLWDVAFVAFYTIVLTFTREFIMQELLQPLAKACGIKSRGKQLRFMEQMYTAIYFGVSGPAGLYVMRQTPVWYFNTRGMYEMFPHRTHEAAFKFYYLFEAAYWAQQALVMVLGMEKPRKDFRELVAHHIVTLSLIGLSYRFHFTYIGIAVYITHDISDFFLAVCGGSTLSLILIMMPIVESIPLVLWLTLNLLSLFDRSPNPSTTSTPSSSSPFTPSTSEPGSISGTT